MADAATSDLILDHLPAIDFTFIFVYGYILVLAVFFIYPLLFKVNKRGVPTVLAYSAAGTADRVDMTGGEKNAGYSNEGETGARIAGVDDASTSRLILFHYTADAEL